MIYSAKVPTLHEGETILGSVDVLDRMTEWVVGQGGEIPALAQPDRGGSGQSPTRSHARRLRAGSRRCHNGRLRRLSRMRG
jgi:hypothetical protein